jgi:ABC-type transport system substrate-binding protein
MDGAVLASAQAAATGQFATRWRLPSFAYTAVVFNQATASSPFRDTRVREALALGIDRAALLRALGADAVNAAGLEPAASWAYVATLPQKLQLAQARALLSQAGYSGLLFNLLVPADPLAQRAATELARQWAGMGVVAQLRVSPLETLVQQRLATGSFEAVLLPVNVGPDPDVSAFWASPQAGGALNFSGAPADPFFDADLSQARVDMSRSVRLALYADAAMRFASLLPGIPLYSPVVTWVTTARVRTVGGPSGHLPLATGLRPDRFAWLASWTVLTARIYPGETPPP